MAQQKNSGNTEAKNSVPHQEPTRDSEPKSKDLTQKPNKNPSAKKKRSFAERWKTNRFWLVRGTYYVLYSVWMVVMAIGAFIAWLIALLFI
ncbi:hypothetical protein [Marixanthomonas spongiae]|nr:hypothetical protein [Marixanthomonas spongiae]